MRNKDPDRERNEAAKLRRQYKQERKGAIRELRKDARFLAGVALQKQMDKDRGYNERMKRVFGSLEGERAEAKAMEKQKMKEKKRAGRNWAHYGMTLHALSCRFRSIMRELSNHFGNRSRHLAPRQITGQGFPKADTY